MTFARLTGFSGDISINPESVQAVTDNPSLGPEWTRVFVGFGRDEYFPVHGTVEYVTNKLEQASRST